MSVVTNLSHIKVYFEIRDKILSKQGRKPILTTHTLIVQLFMNPNTVYTRVQVERVYKSNPIFEAKNTTFLEKV